LVDDDGDSYVAGSNRASWHVCAPGRPRKNVWISRSRTERPAPRLEVRFLDDSIDWRHSDPDVRPRHDKAAARYHRQRRLQDVHARASDALSERPLRARPNA